MSKKRKPRLLTLTQRVGAGTTMLGYYSFFQRSAAVPPKIWPEWIAVLHLTSSTEIQLSILPKYPTSRTELQVGK